MVFGDLYKLALKIFMHLQTCEFWTNIAARKLFLNWSRLDILVPRGEEWGSCFMNSRALYRKFWPIVVWVIQDASNHLGKRVEVWRQGIGQIPEKTKCASTSANPNGRLSFM
ncbi:hypothetical protein Mp_1g11640 [Marchantia polymorpha subsp. ruderalis]|uniref:Uncharacterized protein n=2 Tax=Marchantia polymorpha TaxID=3197 RepID=A0AAF6AP29_MARPO|nr:hypothetical protein MARPO_0014s0062 [Marchantia polymorpha]BBM98199.1 hypothetical protein Mp_1g11640 [Marchantia polymorpha subsp. ruderalis]|eukprot:PTQ45521.1 hypothetical protein MARPO_0014s0062 [Marchantia polymorpha]